MTSEPNWIGIPRVLESFLNRPRLVEILHQRAPLSCVSGESGSGKTVLVADWVHNNLAPEDRVVWLTDTINFSSDDYLAKSLIDQGFVAGLLSLDKAEELKLALSGKQFDKVAAALIEMFSGVGQNHTLLVIEGFSDQKPEDVALVSKLIQYCHGLNIILITEAKTVFESSQLITEFPIQSISQSDLDLSPEEIVALAKVSYDIVFNETVAEIIGKYANYKIYGVRQILTQMKQSYYELQEWGEATFNEFWADYSVQTFSSKNFTEDLKVFIAVTSMSDTASIELVKKLSDAPNPEKILKNLVDQDYGYWVKKSGDDSKKVFRYRSWLKFAAQRYFAEEHGLLYKQTALKLAHFFLSKKNPVSAIRFSIVAKDSALAETLIRQNFASIGDRVLDEIAMDLEQLPNKKINESALFSLIIALMRYRDILQRGNSYRMFESVVQIVERSLRKELSISKVIWLRTLSSVSYRYLGNTKEALAEAKIVHESIKKIDSSGVEELGDLFGVVLFQVGLSAMYDENFPFAISIFQHGIEWSTQYNRSGFGGVFRGVLALLRTFAGNFEHASKLLSEIPSSHSLKLQDQESLTFFQFAARALLLINNGDHAAALICLEQIKDPKTISEYWAEYSEIKGIARAMSGDVSGAESEVSFFLNTYCNSYSAPGPAQIIKIFLKILRSATGYLNSTSDPDITPKHLYLTGIESALLSVRCSLGGYYQQAFDALVIGQSSHATVYQEALNCVAALLLSNRAPEFDLDYKQFLFQMINLEDRHFMRWPICYLPEKDRAELLAKIRADSTASAEIERFSRALDLIPTIVPEKVELVDLSAKETEVLQRLVKTANREEIARAMFVSENTVKSHLSSLYRKLGVTKRADALSKAVNQGLLVTEIPEADTDWGGLGLSRGLIRG